MKKKNTSFKIIICFSIIFFCIGIGFVNNRLYIRKCSLTESHFCEALSIYEQTDSNFVVHPFLVGKEYIVVIPAYWDTKKLFATYQDDNAQNFSFENILINRKPTEISITLDIPYSITNNKLLSKVSPAESIRFIQSSQNTLFINTESGSFKQIDASRDKSYGEKGLLLAVSESGIIHYKGKFSNIHGRGNMTWNSSKKPYNLKLKKAVSLFGLNKAQKYNLLSNDFDESGLRNWILFNTTERLQLPFSVKSTFITLFRNGHYSGLYQLTNKIGLDSTSVNISNLEEETKLSNNEKLSKFQPFSINKNDTIGFLKGIQGVNNPLNITGGYLLETNFKLHRYAEDPSGFIPEYGYPINIKSPKYATKEQVEYISGYYKETMDAIRASDGINPQTKKHYSEYIDVDSFIYYYLCSEIYYNLDAVFASFFMYKDKNSKLCCGPLWDYDLSLNTKVYFDKANGTNSLFVKEAREQDGSLMIFGQLYKHKDYRKRLIELFNYKFLPILQCYCFGNTLDSINIELKQDLEMNLLRWPYNTQRLYNTLRAETTWNTIAQKEYEEIEQKGDFWNIKNFLTKRVEYLCEIWNNSMNEDNYKIITWDFGYKEQFQHTSTRISYLVRDDEDFVYPRFFTQKANLQLIDIVDELGNHVNNNQEKLHFKMIYENATPRN